MAPSIHTKMKRLCRLPGAEQKLSERSEEDPGSAIARPNRRNVYRRSEGLVYSGSVAKLSINNLAKQHNRLVTIDLPDESDRVKYDD